MIDENTPREEIDKWLEKHSIVNQVPLPIKSIEVTLGEVECDTDGNIESHPVILAIDYFEESKEIGVEITTWISVHNSCVPISQGLDSSKEELKLLKEFLNTIDI